MDAGKTIELRKANAADASSAVIGISAFVIAIVMSLTGCQVYSVEKQQRPVSELASDVLAARNQTRHIARVAAQHQNQLEDARITYSDADGEVALAAFDQVAAPLPRESQPVDDLFVDTDVREAIQSLATQANVSVVVDDSVTGVVTATINQEPFETALSNILLPLGLHFRWYEGQYLICSADPESAMFSMVSERLQYEPLHSSPQELADLLPEKDQGFARVAASRNLIIVEAPARLARQIHQELVALDQPVAQVILEAMVVVVSPDSKFQFGMDLSQGVTSGDRNFNLSLDGLALAGNWTGDMAKDLFGNFAVTSHFIRALEQEGYVSIRATPHVMAKNGEKAEISIARETFFSTQPISSQVFLRQDIQKVEAGITLEITPSIRGDSVSMAIDRAEVSENIRSALNDASLADPYPLINRRKVSTTVNVKDGETMVIGGLMQNQVVDRMSKVPILGDIPLVGKLFQKVEQSEEAAEVVVFISPRVVRYSDSVDNVSDFMGPAIGLEVMTPQDGRPLNRVDRNLTRQQRPTLHRPASSLRLEPHQHTQISYDAEVRDGTARANAVPSDGSKRVAKSSSTAGHRSSKRLESTQPLTRSTPQHHQQRVRAKAPTVHRHVQPHYPQKQQNVVDVVRKFFAPE